jgi:C-terminal processing protease CtpA/Prc
MAGLNDDEDGSGEPALTDEEARLSRPLDKNGWFIGTDERDRIIAEQEQLSEGIGVGPAYNQRERRMYVKITKLPEGSLAEERGFQVDDVLRQINGNDIVSKSALVRFIQKNPDLTHYSIEIERRGVRIVKTFQIAR